MTLHTTFGEGRRRESEKYLYCGRGRRLSRRAACTGRPPGAISFDRASEIDGLAHRHLRSVPLAKIEGKGAEEGKGRPSEGREAGRRHMFLIGGEREGGRGAQGEHCGDVTTKRERPAARARARVW